MCPTKSMAKINFYIIGNDYNWPINWAFLLSIHRGESGSSYRVDTKWVLPCKGGALLKFSITLWELQEIGYPSLFILIRHRKIVGTSKEPDYFFQLCMPGHVGGNHTCGARFHFDMESIIYNLRYNAIKLLYITLCYTQLHIITLSVRFTYMCEYFVSCMRLTTSFDTHHLNGVV